MLMKVTIRAILLVFTSTLSIAAYALADAPKHVDIPAGDLSRALLKLSKQYGTELVYRPEQVHGLKTHGAHGQFTTEQAVTLLLQGTPLELRTDPSGAMLIAPPTSGSAQAADISPHASGAPSQDASDGSKEGKKSSSDEFRVAQADQGSNSQSPSVASSASSAEKNPQQSNTLEEVIVTAQKKTENLQDVPIPMSVISSATLTNNNQVRISDYYTQVPGLSIAPSTQSTQTLSIRGITTGAVSNGPPAPGPTVGIMIDGVPFGGSGGGDTMVPDVDPGDLARVEVLRGPQGTLYGASSLGGLVNFVTLDPSTDAVHGRLEAGTDSVYNGAELGYTVRGSVNVPVTSDFAVRASGFYRQDAGYIDNPVLGIRGINEDNAYGGHLAALWTVSDSLSIKFSALYQQINGNGTNDVTPHPPSISGFPATLGNLQQGYIQGVGPFHRTTQASSAVVTDKIGAVTLTSLTGYNSYTVHDETDGTFALGALSDQYFGIAGTPQVDHINFNRFTEELRVAAPLGPNVDLLLGGYYSHAVDHYRWDEFASNPITGQIVGDWGSYNLFSAPITYTDYAAFGDLTYHITDRFDVQVGGRESFYDVVGKPWTDVGQLATVWVGPPICTTTNCVAFPEYNLHQNAFTYLLTPRFKFTPDVMAYARLASGFREGGSNAGTPGAPLAYGPDKTKDYELGMKGYFLQHVLSVDASVYYVDWRNIQLPLYTPIDTSYTGNGGAAKSEGAELTVEAKPVRGLTLTAWVAYDEAELTEAVPSIFGYSGDRLPNTPRFSGSFSPQYDFPLWGSMAGFAGGTIAYVGSREDVFSQESAQRQYLPPYAKTDLRAGTHVEDWTVNLYVNNVTDKRGVISGGYGNAEPFAFYLIQPRTVGLSVIKSF